VTHCVGLVFAYLALVYTFLIGKWLKGFWTGFLSAVLLMMSPLFFAQSGILNFAMPLTAFMMMAIYYALKDKHYLYFLFASLDLAPKS
jgi:4-amino-4-deoxy-L-arabinose transferase-like glycosyltransferase